MDELVRVLAEEHITMRGHLTKAKESAASGDFTTVVQELKNVDPLFRQHIADEESQLLGFLIKELGVEGAAEEIRVFQQHRPMFQLMQKVRELARLSAAEISGRQQELMELFDLHTRAEETTIYPKSMRLFRKS